MVDRYNNQLIKRINKEDFQRVLKNFAGYNDQFDQAMDVLDNAIASNISRALEDNNYSGKILDNYEAGIDIANRISKNGKSLNDLSEILDIISDVSDILSVDKIYLAFVLRQAGITLPLGYNMPKQNSIVNIPLKQIDIICRSIISIVQKYNTITNKQGQLKTNENFADSLAGSINFLFGSEFNEIFQAAVNAQLVSFVNKNIYNTLQDNWTGKNKEINENTISDKTFKADVFTKNCTFSIDNIIEDTIRADIGLNLKLADRRNGAKNVRILSNKPFSALLKNLFFDDLYSLYNTVELNDNSRTKKAFVEMKKSIAANYADYFLSGTGIGSNFSQFLVINNDFYSIRKILQDIMMAKDVSKFIILDMDEQKAIDEREKYKGTNKESQNRYAAWMRTKRIINTINKLKVNAKLNLKSLNKIVIS